MKILLALLQRCGAALHHGQTMLFPWHEERTECSPHLHTVLVVSYGRGVVVSSVRLACGVYTWTDHVDPKTFQASTPSMVYL